MSRYYDPKDSVPYLAFAYSAPGSAAPPADGQQRQVPEAAAVAAEDAMKEAAWQIADRVALADWGPVARQMAPDERAEAVERLNRLMNAAARLAGQSTRDDWSRQMIDARALAQDS